MIVPLTIELAVDVALRLCLRDRREIVNMLPDGQDIIRDWTRSLVQVADTVRTESIAVLIPEGEEMRPAAMGGLRTLPGYADQALAWFVGTDRKQEAGLAIMRRAETMHEQWKADGIRRFSATCLDTGDENWRWMEHLGYSKEGVLRGFGRNGDDYIIWGMCHGRN